MGDRNPPPEPFILLSNNGQFTALSKRKHGVSTRQQVHHAHLAPSATNRETGNRTENRGSNPRVCPNLTEADGQGFGKGAGSTR